MKSEFYSGNACLHIPLKILVLMHNCASINSPDFYVDHFYLEPFSILDHVYDNSQIWERSTQEWLALLMTSSKIKTSSFMDILITPHFPPRKWNENSMSSEYWQPIPQKCSCMSLMSLEYFSVSLSVQDNKLSQMQFCLWFVRYLWTQKC